MKHITWFTLAVMMLPGPHSRAQLFSSDDPIRLVLPPSINSRSCQLQYFLVGSFGGYGGFARPKPNASEFEIETLHEGTAAESLKALRASTRWIWGTLQKVPHVHRELFSSAVTYT
jgi:hypothetical protein